jgi:hypothetical protein
MSECCSLCVLSGFLQWSSILFIHVDRVFLTLSIPFFALDIEYRLPFFVYQLYLVRKSAGSHSLKSAKFIMQFSNFYHVLALSPVLIGATKHKHTSTSTANATSIEAISSSSIANAQAASQTALIHGAAGNGHGGKGHNANSISQRTSS